MDSPERSLAKIIYSELGFESEFFLGHNVVLREKTNNTNMITSKPQNPRSDKLE
jgi:hypothetical protein